MLNPTVVSYVSTAIEMLEFSEAFLRVNTGKVPPYRRLIVVWDPSPEVEHWLSIHSRVEVLRYQPDLSLGYVPNLRRMMMAGWEASFSLGDWMIHTDTDVMYGMGWMSELLNYPDLSEETIINCTHITPNVRGPHVVTADFGRPTRNEFRFKGFWKLHDELRRPGVYQPEDRAKGGWESCATMPYLINRRWWLECGPWESTLNGRGEAPDRQFFRRCHEAGARFVLALGSVVYHYEGGERRSGRRPGQADGLPEEGIVQ